MKKEFRCFILRGGTSKGVFLLEEDLPQPGSERDRVIKRIMGTPDPRQIDGLGGADILTSKVAIIGKPTLAGADVDYTFAQVGIQQDFVSYEGNCGNISAAVGPFAIERGFVKNPQDGIVTVWIHNTNIKKLIRAEVPVQHGRPLSEGNYEIDGVPRSGARINLDFSQSAGSVNGKLFPTGNVQDVLEIPGWGHISASLVDLANPVCFVRADALKLKGDEGPKDLESRPDLIGLMELIRGVAATKLGFTTAPHTSLDKSPYVPFFCFVAAPQEHSVSGKLSNSSGRGVDINARIVAMGKTHKAFPGTGAVCLAAAAKTNGTVVSEVLRNHEDQVLRIGHPSGVVDVEIQMAKNGSFEKLAFGRTWRKIMEGTVFI